MSDFRNSSMRAVSPNILVEDAEGEKILNTLNEEPIIREHDIIQKDMLALPRDPVSGGEDEATTSPRRAAKKKKAFNPSIYRFKRKDYNFKQEAFIESFYEHKKADKVKINQRLVEQTYLQVLHRFEKEKKVSIIILLRLSKQSWFSWLKK